MSAVARSQKSILEVIPENTTAGQPSFSIEHTVPTLVPPSWETRGPTGRKASFTDNLIPNVLKCPFVHFLFKFTGEDNTLKSQNNMLDYLLYYHTFCWGMTFSKSQR